MKDFIKHYLVWAAACIVTILISSCDKVSEGLQPSVDLENGLVYYFPFSGNSTDQVSMASYNTHGAEFETDRFNAPKSALCMTENYMDLNAGFGEDDAGTLSFWINLRDVNSFHPLFIKNYTSFVPGEYSFSISVSGLSARCTEKWGTDDGDPVFAPATIKANKWYHVLLRWSDEDGKMDIFLDNNKLVSDDYAKGIYESLGTEYITMGLYYQYPGGHEDPIPNYFRGKMDEIRRYDRWLNDDEVAALYE